jgi:2-oxoglutarate ferredoxin oxidoreductase subunit beta
VAPAASIKVEYAEGESVPVTMHDGSRIVLRKIDKDYNPTDRGSALARIRERLREQEYLTGLLHISTNQPEFHELNATPEQPLNQIPYAKLNPGPAALAKTLARFR